ncbi:MAG: NAD(P)/FAD-dependent oxidoreductase [Actinomycetota bacterium]|jgi:phytoene dehydrogenase-like protein
MAHGQSCDVVVIGAGHNGLVAANYLADAGHDVIVAEASDRVGGMTASSAGIPDAPHHVINHFAFDPFFWDSFPPGRELGLEGHGLRRVRVDPGLVYLDPDGSSIAFWEDPRRTAEEIRRFSAADGDAYLEFARLLRGLGDILLEFALMNPTRIDAGPLTRTARAALRWRRQLPALAHLALGPARDAIGERFRHPVVRNALHAVAGATIPNGSDGTGLGFLWLSMQHRHSHRHAVGGIQALPDALAARLRAVGGRLLLGTPVTEIVVDGKASGVRLADGGVITARRAVLAACDPRTALERLLPPGVLAPAMEARVRNIPVSNNDYGQMKVDLALSGQLRLSRHERWRGDGLDLRRPMHVLGTEEGIARAFARSAAGLLPYEDDFSLWTVIPTGVDPSQAPEGQDTLYVYCAVAPYRPEDGWEKTRDAAGNAVVAKVSKFFDGVEELEIGRQVLTNEDIARLANATGGNITHVDMVLSRGGPLRPARGLGGYRTPVEGLFLGGAGSHPGGGITGAPGYMAAREILRFAGPSSPRSGVRRARAPRIPAAPEAPSVPAGHPPAPG